MHNSNNYRAEIQGLRALAVILVVIYHSGTGLFPGGYIGVDVFFVISGYLVAGPILQSLNESGRFNLLDFYARRVRRLLPAAVLVLLATIAVFREIYSPLELKIFSSSAITTAVYFSNFWFAHLATDYLATEASPNPLLHTWSLSVEEQFYIIWPLLFIAIHKFFAKSRGSNTLIWATVVVSILSFCACVFLTSYAQAWAFFMCFTRFWEFGLGAMAAVLLRTVRISNLMSRSGAVLGWLLIIGPALLFSTLTQFPGYLVALPAIGTTLLLLCVDSGRPHLSYSLLSNPVAKYFGDISYSLYLWHWPVFVYLHNKALSDDTLFQVLGVTVSVFLASATYYLIENPIRFAFLLRKNAYRTLGFAVFLTATSLAVGVHIREEAKDGLTSPTQKRLLAVKESRPRIYTDGCHNQFLDIELNNCSYGDEKSRTKIALFGDSHAAHWFPALEIVATNHDAHLTSYTKSSCPSVMFEPYDVSYKRAYKECTEWRLRAISALKKLKPDYLVISNSDEYQKTQPLSGQQWSQGLNDLLLMLNLERTKIIIMHDIPHLPFDGPVCLARADWQEKNPRFHCRFEINKATNKSVRSAEIDVANKWRNVFAFDPSALVCDGKENCSLQQEGMVKYFDSNHLSVAFSKQLGSELDNLLFR